MHALRLRSAAWFATGVVLTLIAAFTITQAWSVDAAPGDEDSTVVAVDPPVRILDTRDGIDVGLPGPFASPNSQKLQVTGSVATTGGASVVVPDGSTGVILNVTAVQPTGAGFISVRPGDASGTPATSSLNFAAGSNTPNAVTVALPRSGANEGEIDITYSSAGATGPTTDVLVDVVGYLTDTSLDEIADDIVNLGSRLDAVGAPAGAQVFDEVAGADAGDRGAATEVPLGTVDDIAFYGKCYLDGSVLEGEIFVRTSASGAILKGDDELPAKDGAEYLDTTTGESDRVFASVNADSNLSADPGEEDEFFNAGDETGFLIQAGGARLDVYATIAVKHTAAPAGDGPLGPGDRCSFGVTVEG